MKRFLKFNLILLLTFLIGSCSELTKVEDDFSEEKSDDVIYTPVIPDSVIKRSDNFLISEVGEQFFSSYIKINPQKSLYMPADSFCIKNPSSCAEYLLKPHYQIVYEFKIPEKGIDLVIELQTDSLGNPEFTYGIPKCINNDCWSNFDIIDKNKAVRIAQKEGLEKGIKDWEVSFHFYSGDLNNYVWTVSTTLKQSGYGWTSHASGKTIVINAFDGTLIGIYGWVRVS